MEEKQLSQEKIGELIASMSPALRAHAARCKLFAEFILTCPGSDRIFLKRMYTEDLLTAVGYHDFGKAFLPKNSTNASFCKKQSEKKAYREHIKKAEEYIKENSDIYPTNATSFDRFLLECSTMHHENFDGTGFGKGLAERGIPLAGRLCAAVNFIDHSLDFDNSGALFFDRLLEDLEAAAGRELDARICKLLIRHRKDFESFCRDMYEDYESNPDSHSHIKILYKAQRAAFDYSPVGYETVVSLYDSNFGEVNSEVFRASCKGETVVKIDRIIRQRIFSQMEALAEKGLDFGRITVVESAHSLRKADYPKQLARLIEDYGIDVKRLTVAVPEEVLYTDPPEIFDTLKAVKSLGVRLSIDGFGELYKTFEVFESFEFDEIRLSNSLMREMSESSDIFHVTAGMVSVARNLAIDVVCSEIASVEDERLMAGMGVNILGGILYGGAVRAEGLEKSIKASVGDANDS